MTRLFHNGEEICEPHNIVLLRCSTCRLAALSRIIRRTLGCGQLEKLEDARPYLDDVPAAKAEKAEGVR